MEENELKYYCFDCSLKQVAFNEQFLNRFHNPVFNGVSVYNGESWVTGHWSERYAKGLIQWEPRL